MAVSAKINRLPCFLVMLQGCIAEYLYDPSGKDSVWRLDWSRIALKDDIPSRRYTKYHSCGGQTSLPHLLDRQSTLVYKGIKQIKHD